MAGSNAQKGLEGRDLPLANNMGVWRPLAVHKLNAASARWSTAYTWTSLNQRKIVLTKRNFYTS